MLQYHLLNWCYQDALRTEFLQLTDDFPETLLIEHGMNRTPVIVCQWDDGRTLDTRQYLGNLLYFALGAFIITYFLSWAERTASKRNSISFRI